MTRVVRGTSLSGESGPWHAKVEHEGKDPSHTACGRDLASETHHLNDWNYAARPRPSVAVCPSCVKVHPPELGRLN